MDEVSKKVSRDINDGIEIASDLNCGVKGENLKRPSLYFGIEIEIPKDLKSQIRQYCECKNN